MHNRRKTKEELLKENSSLMQRIHELEISGAERNLTIEALKDKEQQLRDTAEKIPGVIYQFYAKPDGVLGLNYVSERVKSIFGLENDPQDFFQRFAARVAPESINSFTESITDAVSNVKPWRYEGRFIKDSGDSIWFQGLSNPVKRGHEIVFNGVLLDITERKQTESELLLSSRRTEALLQLGQMAVASLKDITDFTLEKAVELTESRIGYLAFLNNDESVLMMHSWSKTAIQECAVSEKPILYNVVDTGLWGEAVRQRKPVITNDYAAENPCKKGYPEGHVKVYRHMNVPIIDSNKIVIVAGVGNKETGYSKTDVQQLTLLMQGMWQLIKRRQAEEESEKLASIVRHSKDLVNLAAPDGSMIFLNETGRNILGLSEEDIISTNIMDVIPDNYKDKARQEILLSLERDGYWEGDLQYQNLKTGNLTEVHAVTFKIIDQETGALQHYANVSQDITERKKSEEALRESESLIRSMYEADPTGVSLTVDRIIKKANRRFCEIAGYPEEEILGKNTRIFYADESEYNRVGKILYDDLKANGIGKIESRWKRKDGSMIDVFLSISPLDPMDWSVGLTSVVLDLSDLKQAQAELIAKSEELDRFFSLSLDLLCIADTDGYFRRLNPEWEVALGYNLSELEGKKFLDLVHSEDLESTLSVMSELSAGKLVLNFTNRYLAKDGTYKWIEWRSIPFENKLIYAAARDITDRKKTEYALRDSESNLRSIFRAAPIGIGLVSDRIIMRVNDRLCEMIGHEREELIGKSARILYPTDEEFNFVGTEKYKQISAHGTGTVETKWLRKDGAIIDVLLSSTPLDPTNLKAGVTFTALDITERKRAEKNLMESMERYRLLAENSTDVIWTMDIDGRFTYISPSVKELSGFTPEEAMAIPLDKYLYVEDLPWVMDILSKEIKKPREERMVSTLVEVRQYKKDGSLLDIEVSTKWLYNEQGEIIGLQGSTRDISARKKMEKESEKLERQLLQAQKMEAIGTLAGGLAHDFNNILTTMQGHVSLMKMGLNAAHPYYSRLEKIEEQIMSSAGITRQLLGFSKGGKYEVKTIKLNDILESSSEVFGRTKKELSISKRFQNDVWAIEADQGQIEQTLFNLYINAWQAMPDGGELYLESRNVFLNDMDVMPHGLKPGRYVIISITDTGVGMDEQTIKRIFEPFYTTKEPGKGTGLGLASAYGIIKNHDGFITVYSEKGKGTTFNIYLPASSKQQTEEDKPAATGTDMGKETILLVDDEAAMVAVTKELLESRGYKVFTAGSGQEAIAVFMEKKDSIDLVILDMIMPGIGGSKTFDHLMNIDPNVKIILASGYSINGEAQRILDKGCKGFIQKPFRIAELSQKIQSVLNMKGSN